MTSEWIAVAVLVSVGIVAVVGLGLGMRDPTTRAYKPGLRGLLGLGRPLSGPKFGDEPDKDKDKDKNAKDGGAGSA